MTFDEWLDDIQNVCFNNIEGCDEPEYSLFTNLDSVISLYRKGKSGYAICNPYEYADDGCPLFERMKKMYDDIEKELS